MDDPLVHLTESTSVFAFADGEATVGTLEEAGFPLVATRATGVRHADAIHARYVHLQVVKRNRRFHLLVDGFAVPADETAVRLEAHAGLHRDPTSDSLVFSPCAVSMLCEDGERQTATCTLSIEQCVVSATGGVVGEVMHLGSAKVPDFGASDALASVVLAPFPIELVRQPRLVIRDLSAVHRYDLKRFDKAVWDAALRD